MDDLDTHLLSLLRGNARMPIATLARTLRVARATVQNRIDRLQEDGTIVGYTLRMKPNTLPPGVRAVMGVEVNGAYSRQVMRAYTGHPNVVALHTTNGRWDLIAELSADSLQAFDQVLTTLRAVEGVAATETSILLSTHKL